MKRRGFMKPSVTEVAFSQTVVNLYIVVAQQYQMQQGEASGKC